MRNASFLTTLIVGVVLTILVSCSHNNGVLDKVPEMATVAISEVQKLKSEETYRHLDSLSAAYLDLERQIKKIKQKSVSEMNDIFEKEHFGIFLPVEQKGGKELFIIKRVVISEVVWDETSEPTININAEFIAKISIKNVTVNVDFVDVNNKVIDSGKLFFSAPNSRTKSRLLSKKALDVGEYAILSGNCKFAHLKNFARIIVK